jgi:hypothetical protein
MKPTPENGHKTVSETGRRLCINCGMEARESGSDPYLIFFCNRCDTGFGFNNMARNNVFMSWVKGRMAQSPNVSLLDGQCDENWPDGFPSKHPLR